MNYHPNTDAGQGEHITVRGGPLPCVHVTAEDSFVQKLNVTTVAMNIAHWTEELRDLDRRKQELTVRLAELQDKEIRPMERHLIRLHARLKELTPAMESFI